MNYQHPPTQCRAHRAAITEADITNALDWFEANTGRIEQALPLKIEGVTYTKRWLGCFQQRAASSMPHNLRVPYVYSDLRRLYRGLPEGP